MLLEDIFLDKMQPNLVPDKMQQNLVPDKMQQNIFPSLSLSLKVGGPGRFGPKLTWLLHQSCVLVCSIRMMIGITDCFYKRLS